MDCSLPGFSVHGILQARTLEWVAILFSRGSSPARDQTQVSCIAGRFFMSEPPGKSNHLSQSAFHHTPFPFLPPHFSHSLLPSFLPASPFWSSDPRALPPPHALSPLTVTYWQNHTLSPNNGWDSQSYPLTATFLTWTFSQSNTHLDSASVSVCLFLSHTQPCTHSCTHTHTYTKPPRGHRPASLTSALPHEATNAQVVGSAHRVHLGPHLLHEVLLLVPVLGVRPPQLRHGHELPHIAVEVHILLRVVDVSGKELHPLQPIGETTLTLKLMHEKRCEDEKDLITGWAPGNDWQQRPPMGGVKGVARRGGSTSNSFVGSTGSPNYQHSWFIFFFFLILKDNLLLMSFFVCFHLFLLVVG